MQLGVIAAAIAVFTGVGAGVGMSLATGRAAEAVSRQPEAATKIQQVLIIGLAMAETTVIFGFVVAVLILFAK